MEKSKQDTAMRRKALRFKIKADSVDETQGQFTGIASLYGIEDLGADVIEAGAFAKTVKERPSVPILWQHDTAEVIGMGELEETKDGLIVKAQLDMEDPVAQKAFRKLKSGLISGLSIGYQTVKWTWEETKEKVVRHINELKLWEVSVVTFPMLPEAQVTSVKEFIDADETLDFIGIYQSWHRFAQEDAKSGRAISKDRADKLRSIANEILALLDEAGSTTSDDGAADKNIEPDPVHSVAEVIRKSKL